MTEYEIFFKESFWKDIKKVPKGALKKIMARIEKLADDPRPLGCEKLADEELYRVRQGNYRIIYSV